MNKPTAKWIAPTFLTGLLLLPVCAVICERGLFLPGGILFILVGIALYISFYFSRKNLVHPVALLSLFWIGGIGVAGLKLSNLSADHWSILTWVSLLGFYYLFLAGYLIVEKLSERKKKRTEPSISPLFAEHRKEEEYDGVRKRLMICIIGMCAVSAAAFLFEAAWLGFIPALIKDTPHAYSEFHVTGVHYFTVSSCFVHPLTLLYLYRMTKGDRRKIRDLLKNKTYWFLVLVNIVAILIPILCVSRFFLIMSVALTLVTFLSIKKNVSGKTLLVLGILCIFILIPGYILLTVFRSHSVEYLNGIFDMKNRDMPIFITQPYMYIANNFENFNCLVTQFSQFSLGRRILFPAVALTGLKFVYPDFVPGVLYLTKEELTTLTLVYDAYYDFGVAGVLVFGGVLGVAAKIVESVCLKNRNPIAYLFYAQIAMYLVLSFFTTWFSNPTTWFWLVITGMMYLFVGYEKRKKQEEPKEEEKAHV